MRSVFYLCTTTSKSLTRWYYKQIQLQLSQKRSLAPSSAEFEKKGPTLYFDISARITHIKMKSQKIFYVHSQVALFSQRPLLRLFRKKMVQIHIYIIFICEHLEIPGTNECRRYLSRNLFQPWGASLRASSLLRFSSYYITRHNLRRPEFFL